MELKLLYAKDAIFKMIAQFCCPTTIGDDNKLCIYNYCESALEAAFDVLGIEENYISVIDFCKMWENNSRAIWAINLPDEPFDGITGEIHYHCFIERYEAEMAWENEEWI